MFWNVLQTLTLRKTGNASGFTPYRQRKNTRKGKMERFRFMGWTCPRSSYIISSFAAASQTHFIQQKAPSERINITFPYLPYLRAAGKRKKSAAFRAET